MQSLVNVIRSQFEVPFIKYLKVNFIVYCYHSANVISCHWTKVITLSVFNYICILIEKGFGLFEKTSKILFAYRLILKKFPRLIKQCRKMVFVHSLVVSSYQVEIQIYSFRKNKGQ